jgi:hypothetical protein
MDRITIIAEGSESPGKSFQASWRGRSSFGVTAGAALDALTAQMQPSEVSTLVIIQNLQPDGFFNASQQLRLQELLEKRTRLKTSESRLSSDEQSELEVLVANELDGSAQRAGAIADELKL